MSFHRIKAALSGAEKIGETYDLTLSTEDFFDLVDMVDALDRRFKVNIKRIKAADLLRLLPPVIA